jgi:tryptophanase
MIEVIEEVWNHRDQIGGHRIVSQPKQLRHFTCHLEPIS